MMKILRLYIARYRGSYILLSGSSLASVEYTLSKFDDKIWYIVPLQGASKQTYKRDNYGEVESSNLCLTRLDHLRITQLLKESLYNAATT